MALFVAEHRHAADRCPAKNPQFAPMLLGLVSNENAQKQGITIHGDAVANGAHHLYLIVDGPNEAAVRQYFAPFSMAGTLDVVPASHCEAVVGRGGC
jgi:hypothetical protein